MSDIIIADKIVDRSKYPLGKQDHVFDSRTLKLEDYLTSSLPTPASSVNWAPTITAWPMLLNDTLGDCTIAACLHAIMVWMLNHKVPFTPTDAEALKYYELFDGYVNGDPST